MSAAVTHIYTTPTKVTVFKPAIHWASMMRMPARAVSIGAFFFEPSKTSVLRRALSFSIMSSPSAVADICPYAVYKL